MKILRTAALVFAMVLFCAVSSYAVPSVGDTVTWTYGPNRINNGGGEFLFTDTNIGETYTTFCVEENETISGNETYYIASIVDFADGGVGFTDNAPTTGSDVNTSDATHDYLSMATEWLFWTYLKAPTALGAAGTDTLAGNVQEAIWYLEDEKDSANSLYSSKVAGRTSFDIPNGVEVKVMNLYDKNCNHRQSQIFLYSSPVPEPGTIMLLGLGLLGLAVGGRKKIFKK